MLAGCASEAVIFNPDASADQSIQALNFAEREAARGRDSYASSHASAGAWLVRCARDTAAVVGTCVLKTHLAEGGDFISSPVDGYGALVADGITEAVLGTETGPLPQPTCVVLITGRPACLWIGEAERIATALRKGKPLSLSRLPGFRQGQLPALGYVEAERAYPGELRAMRMWRDREMSGAGGAGGGSM